MEDGTIQNIAQLKACREAFQQQLAVTDNKERKRYREYDEADYNYNIPSCGIVTCGKFYIFGVGFKIDEMWFQEINGDC